MLQMTVSWPYPSDALFSSIRVSRFACMNLIDLAWHLAHRKAVPPESATEQRLPAFMEQGVAVLWGGSRTREDPRELVHPGQRHSASPPRAAVRQPERPGRQV
jgi:hypothetical protein